ncbi:hypothetical protein AF77_01600 [Aliarcobacter butzleri L352]|uniref:Uncharacterized protein n=2 Tax=Aliarcobacter butzleri TaxID=28197 RepID=A0A837JEZ5_9BACT|nr:hypothetical protein AF77_01600 [Aliarcobacter butzleri L352]
MMFFDEDDNNSKDKLFIFLRNINYLMQLKMYGSHTKGTFEVYIKEYQQKKIIEELQLSGNNGNFSFEDFLETLNSQIPNNIQRTEKIQTIRQIWTNLDGSFKKEIIAEADKTILKGIIKLELPRKPREQTLRKAYTYIDAEPSDITELIDLLVDRNITLAWTDNPNSEISFVDVIAKLK